MGKDNIEKALFRNEIEIVLKSCKKEDIIEYYQDKVLSYNDAELAFWFAKIMADYNIDVKKFGKIIIDNKSLQQNYYFARYLNGADVKEHGKVILESKNLEYNYRFLATIPAADVKAHEKILFESNNSNYIYLYALLINEKTKDKYSTDKILRLLLESNNKGLIRNYYEKRKEFLESINKKEDFEKILFQKDKILKKELKHEQKRN